MNVHVEYRRANQVYEDVFSNVVDMGLVAYPVKDSKLEIIPLRKEPLVLICHPQHPFAKQKTIRLKQLIDQKVIGFEPDIPTRKALDKILREYGVDVKHVMEFDNVETVKRAVEIDAGVSIVPLGTVTQEVAKQPSPPWKSRTANFSAPGGHLQEEQGALAGHEAVPGHPQGRRLKPALRASHLRPTAARPLPPVFHDRPSASRRPLPGSAQLSPAGHFKFFGLSGSSSLGRKRPSLRISSPSNHTSPPPHSGRWISTMSQWMALLLPLPQSS